jgi:hypothetical protein
MDIPVLDDTYEVRGVNDGVRLCALMGIVMARRARYGRAPVCPVFPGSKADCATDGGRPSAAGSARTGSRRGHHGRRANDTYFPE